MAENTVFIPKAARPYLVSIIVVCVIIGSITILFVDPMVERRVKSEFEITGLRPGEKIHEQMITEADSPYTYDIGPYYVILPSNGLVWQKEEYCKNFSTQKVEVGFQYDSGSNERFLTIEELRELIREHVDPTFTVS